MYQNIKELSDSSDRVKLDQKVKISFFFFNFVYYYGFLTVISITYIAAFNQAQQAKCNKEISAVNVYTWHSE